MEPKMDTGKKILRFIIYVGVILLQLIMTQVVTFLITLFLPYSEDFPLTQPLPFVILLGVTFSVGVFLAGGLALKLGWLKTEPLYLWRLAGALIGAYLPLILSLILHKIEAGSPFFFFSILASILGFYLPGWIDKQPVG
jgi:hypothetical protein